ncbi:hypothetical protein N9R54_00275 [Pelobium sp.]|nr:hypothetical protein [Pelobium sp.]MDA9554643.1 hypothetical protein [Pelobium sp.]
MKEVLYLTVRAEVNSSYEKISEIIQEIEQKGVIIISDTPNVQVLDVEILLTRFRKPKN